jgi:preprotein translocase subunit SecA
MNFFKKIMGKLSGQNGKSDSVKTAAEPLKENEKTQQKNELPQKKEKTDEEVIAELNTIAPGIFAQAKTPEMKKTIIKIYRKMLEDGVDVNNEKEVQKWADKNAHLFQNSDAPKIETYRRETPKIGRNDPCPCGSGKKYKKCCGAEEKNN